MPGDEERGPDSKEIESFRASEAAGYLKMTRRRLLLKAHAGEIPYVVVGRKHYFNPDDLDRYARGKMPKPDLKAQEAESKQLEIDNERVDRAIAVAEKEGWLLKPEQIQQQLEALAQREGNLREREKVLGEEASNYLIEITVGLDDWTDQLNKREKEYGGDYKERQKELSAKLSKVNVRLAEYNALIDKYNRGARALMALSHCLPTEYFNRIADAMNRNLEQGKDDPIDLKGCMP